jgi:hypothetical protein
MTEWITVEHFVAVLKANGFEVAEADGWLVIARDTDRYPYQIRPDRRVPPKTFARFTYKYNIKITEFVAFSFKR